jgi:hypothetical protein
MATARTAAATAATIFVAVMVLVFACRRSVFAATGGFVTGTGTAGGFTRNALRRTLAGTATLTTTESVTRQEGKAHGQKEW